MPQKATSRSVGRPREFDEEAVLEAAMDAFWTNGYEATSMSDLCRCTGLHKGSLYQAFGGKHELFMDALKHYSDSELRDVASVALQSASPLQNIRAAVEMICDQAGHDKGCLVINSMVELAPHDPEVRAAVRRFAQQRFRFMADMIGKAQQAGEIRVKQEPPRLARQLMLTLAGGAVMVKGLIGPDDMRAALKDLIESWI